MYSTQTTAANNAAKLFSAFKAKTGDDPRFAVGGFGGAAASNPTNDELREVTDVFVDTQAALNAALGQLTITGGYEEGYKALIDTFNPNNGYLKWDFTPNGRVCVIIFTDEDSDGPETAANVIIAKGSNSIIPVLSSQFCSLGSSCNPINGDFPYPPVSSLSAPGYISMDDFNNPAKTDGIIDDMVQACVDTPVSYTHLTLPTNREV